MLYTVETEPRPFRFSSTNTDVAEINGGALLSARTPGVTRLVALSAGIADSLWLIVGPPVASLRVTVTPATAKVGDTLTVQVDALAANGEVVAGAEVQPPQLLPPSDKRAAWLLPSSRAYRGFPSYTFPTPLVDRLLAREAGVLGILVAAPHDSGRRLRYVAESTFVTVTAP